MKTTSQPVKDDGMQGEGNYDAARRHRQHTEQFIQKGGVGPAARKAEPHGKDEARALEDAEREGLRHAKR